MPAPSIMIGFRLACSFSTHPLVVSAAAFLMGMGPLTWPSVNVPGPAMLGKSWTSFP